MTSERFLHPVSPAGRPDEAALRATVERLAVIERPPCSPGEREAAHLIADRLRAVGARARVEEVPAYPSYALPLWALAALATAAGLLGARSRLLGALAGAVATAGLADELAHGRRLARAALARRRTACNVVAGLGDPNARRTLVVTAHHTSSGRPSRFGRRWFFGRDVRTLPVWWPLPLGALLVAAGAAMGHSGARRSGTVVSALASAFIAYLDADARHSRPGGRDVPAGVGGLGGVAVLVAFAESVRRRPLHGLRVVLLSAGAAHGGQEGARAFARDRSPGLARSTTWFLDLDEPGTGELVLLGAEGALWPVRHDGTFGELVARCAVEQGVALYTPGRGPVLRATATVASVARSHGYPTACLVSTPPLVPYGEVAYGQMADAAQVAEAVARALTPH